MIGLFLGAGFSKWAANLPLAADLFDFDIKPHNRRDKARLDRMIWLKSAWDGAHPTRESERFIRDMIDMSESNRRLVIWYVTRRLSEPFIGTMLGGTQALMIDDSRRFQELGIVLAAAFLEPAPKLAGIITTNYDLLIEYALGTSGFNYGVLGQELEGRGKNPWFPWQGVPVKLTGTVKLAKLHGSVSWTSDHLYTDGRCGVRGDALVVPPDGSKNIPAGLSQASALARAVLAESTTLAIFGFAFNAYDGSVLDLLGCAHPKEVVLVDPDPKENPARILWPGAEIQCVAPPRHAIDEAADWWRSVFASEEFP